HSIRCHILCLVYSLFFFFFFFFSSRRRHTRSKRDWSSDVCSSDLGWPALHWPPTLADWPPSTATARCRSGTRGPATSCSRWTNRSEERRVGKECRSRWGPYQ